MQIPEAALLLAGMTMAHAAWSISDLPQGELLVPLAFVLEGDRPALHRFEAENQSAAFARGLAMTKDWTGHARPWAFARDGILNEGGRKVDALIVEFWAPPMTDPVQVVQRYIPFARTGAFKLIGGFSVTIRGIEQGPETTMAISAGVRAGIAQHPKVATLWATWQ